MKLMYERKKNHYVEVKIHWRKCKKNTLISHWTIPILDYVDNKKRTNEKDFFNSLRIRITIEY